MQLVILAGGKGTRLQERLGAKPKPLIEIAGRPLLDFQLCLAQQFSCTDVHILIGYGAEYIKKFCESGEKWGVSIHCHEEASPAGTAGAVLRIIDQLADKFIVMYGDTMLDVNLRKFAAIHRKSKADATILLHPNDHPEDSDLVELDQDNFVKTFHSYPHPAQSYLPNLVNAALYVINKDALKHIPYQQGVLDFGKHVFPELLRTKKKIYGYRSIEYIKDIGTPKRLDSVTADYLAGKIKSRSLDFPKQAIFLDRDGTINVSKGHISSPDKFDLLPDVPKAIKKINKSGMLAVVVTNQPVIARGELLEQGLTIIHNRMDYLLGKFGAFVDALYYCPHHPDKGFAGENVKYKIICRCRKPAIGLLKQAKRDLNIDFSQSWLVGDTTSDVETARRAKIKSILLHTGMAGRDLKYFCRPDFEFYKLHDAVNFILNIWQKLFSLTQTFAAKIKPGDLVLVGGLARSGKSTFASSLKYALQGQGINALNISTDSWLLSKEQRGKDGILQKYDLVGIEKMAAKIIAGKGGAISLPYYVRHEFRQIANALQIRVKPSDVVIIDGVVSLLLDKLLKNAQHTFYVKCSSESRERTFYHEYRGRGIGEDEILHLYQRREREETPVIANTEKVAQNIVDLGDI